MQPNRDNMFTMLLKANLISTATVYRHINKQYYSSEELIYLVP